MDKDQKADLIIGAATAAVLIGLGILAAKNVYEDLKGSGALDQLKEDAAKLKDKVAVAAGAKSPAELKKLVDDLVNQPRVSYPASTWDKDGKPA